MTGWALLAYQVVGAFVSLYYLSGFAFLVAASIAICTAWAASLVGREAPASAMGN
jgi:hypothetical protein